MSKKQCAFCGKEFEGESNCCNECNEHAEKRQSTVFCEEKRASFKEKGVNNQPEETVCSETAKQEKPKEKKKKNKVIKKVLTALMVIFILFIAGGGYFYLLERKNEEAKALEVSLWYSCIEVNTPSSYANYLLNYPQGEYSKEALARIRGFREEEEKAWGELQKSPDLNDYYTFLSIYPETPFRNKIKWVMDSLTWEITLKENTPESYLAYIENSELGNLEGHYRKMAQDKYDYLSSIKEVEGDELDLVKLRMKNIFESLSDKNYPNLEEYLSPQVSNLLGIRNLSASAGADSLKKRMETEKIELITYMPSLDSIPLKKDNKGVYFSRFEVVQDIKYKGKQKTEQLQDTAYLELDNQRKIKNLFITKRESEE